MLAVSHSISEETIEAKVAWFKSLSPEERVSMFCQFTELALSCNPKLADLKDVEQLKRGIRILEKK